MSLERVCQKCSRGSRELSLVGRGQPVVVVPVDVCSFSRSWLSLRKASSLGRFSSTLNSYPPRGMLSKACLEDSVQSSAWCCQGGRGGQGSLSTRALARAMSACVWPSYVASWRSKLAFSEKKIISTRQDENLVFQAESRMSRHGREMKVTATERHESRVRDGKFKNRNYM